MTSGLAVPTIWIGPNSDVPSVRMSVVLPWLARRRADGLNASGKKAPADAGEGFSTICCVCSIHNPAGGGAHESIH